MKRRRPRWNAGVCLGYAALLAATSTAADAQTWRWQHVTRTPNRPPIIARSTVRLADGELSMTYTVPTRERDVTIEACHARISDVQNATTVDTQGRTYLLVQLKPRRAATCASGRLAAMALPVDKDRHINAVVAAINRSCCATPAVARLATPSPLARTTAAPDGTSLKPVRLLRRGTSRLAIGQTGTALVRLMIAGNGTPQEATIVSTTNSRLAAAAIETAVSSTYAPATQNGKPVAAKYIATFDFDGEDPALSAVPMWKRSAAPATPAVPAVPTASASAAASTLPAAVAEPSALPSPTAEPSAVPSPLAEPSAGPLTTPAAGSEASAPPPAPAASPHR